MSVPIYNGGIVGAIDADARPYIVDDGNWSMQGSDVGPAWRALALFVNDSLVFGYRPALKREQFDQALAREGVLHREQLFDWRGAAQEPGARVEMILTGGNRHWYGSVGDDTGDWMEWGSQDPVDVSKTIVATTGVLIVAGGTVTPPTPPADDVFAQLAEMVDNVEAEMKAMSAKNFEAWKRDNPKEHAAIADYVCRRAFAEHPTPPSLKTHAGRAACGIAQNGVLCQDEL